jgi:hypothetical protein
MLSSNHARSQKRRPQPPSRVGPIPKIRLLSVGGVILETAFDEACSGSFDPETLGRICLLAMEGERDPVRLHDRAPGELSARHSTPGA